ncbi:hypothetical protein FPQ18DRAFT_361207 [Pyronema domesticum]|nr:hypothetical protein FPQ18DRAFT_361207 [Pyronema domesticum]
MAMQKSITYIVIMVFLIHTLRCCGQMTAELLLEKGADIESQGLGRFGSGCVTSLPQASRKGHTAVVQLLLGMG